MRRTRARVGGFHACAGSVALGAVARPAGEEVARPAGEEVARGTQVTLYPRRVPQVSDHSGELGDLPIFWRHASLPPGTPATVAPALYLHGVPTSSDDWLAFLQRSGGIAPDLPGFGRSGKPGYLKYTIDEYADFIERFLDMLEVPRVRMVVHDWGAVGLAFAQRHPERIERLVVMNAVTFLPGYRWHRTARIWRTPLLGELAMGTTTRWVLKQSTRESNAKPGPMPDAWIDSVLAHFDEGTQRTPSYRKRLWVVLLGPISMKTTPPGCSAPDRQLFTPGAT